MTYIIYCHDVFNEMIIQTKFNTFHCYSEVNIELVNLLFVNKIKKTPKITNYAMAPSI